MNSIEIAKSVIEDPEYPASVAKMAADFLEAVELLDSLCGLVYFRTPEAQKVITFLKKLK